MYSDVESVRVLVALLAAYGIQDAVLSSGTCSIPVLYTLQCDKRFNCYSDVDERSAVYFAMGIAQMKNQPVAVVCTSGTAACNYLPGVREAMNQHVPLVIITCDKDPNTLGHLTIQKINQQNMYADNCKFSVCLPIIKDGSDRWAVKTYIQQALLELDHYGKGPVHINIYTDGDKKTFNTPNLPILKQIERYDYWQLNSHKNELQERLSQKKRILLILGEMAPLDDKCVKYIESFAHKYNVAISAEYVANFNSYLALNTYKLTEQLPPADFIEKLKPDLIISMGGNFTSYEIKTLMKRAGAEHWWIDPAGQVVDIWRSIKAVFECSPIDFFEAFAEDEELSGLNQLEYSSQWKAKIDAVKIPKDNKFTSLYAVRGICKHLSKVKVLHAGILNSSRLIQMFDIPRNIRVYSNLGALGIDGSLSSFLGQAQAVTDGISLCILGDLSFIYDINALFEQTLPTNIRIVLLNNGGGSEFHLNTGIKTIPELDEFISAGHTSKAEAWVKAVGMQYYGVSNREELSETLDDFFDAPKAAFMEIFTDIEDDAVEIKDMYALNGYSTNQKKTGVHIRKLLMKTFGIQKTQRIAQMVKIWRGR